MLRHLLPQAAPAQRSKEVNSLRNGRFECQVNGKHERCQTVLLRRLSGRGSASCISQLGVATNS